MLIICTVAKRHGRGLKFPKSVQWKVDCDYAAKLSPEELAWLDDFTNKHYAAPPAYVYDDGPSGSWSATSRRAAYVERNASNRDTYTYAPLDRLDDTPATRSVESDTTVDQTPTPAYQATAEYRELLAEYRERPTPALKRRLLELAGGRE